MKSSKAKRQPNQSTKSSTPSHPSATLSISQVDASVVLANVANTNSALAINREVAQAAFDAALVDCIKDENRYEQEGTM